MKTSKKTKSKRLYLKPGLKRGKLTLIKRIANKVTPSDSRTQWIALCGCGRKEKIVGRNFARVKYPSCKKCK